jgi:4-nitrophenyl phosphatase
LYKEPPKTYVFDLDGVIYRGDEPQPHASETVRELRLLNRKVYFFTNNSTKSREDYQAKLRGMDIPAELDEIMTSAHATALYLKSEKADGSRAYVVGEAGLIHELTHAGVEVVQDGSGGPIDYVVVGLDREFTYKKLTYAQQAVLSGADFIATNRDSTFPVESGTVLPGGGSMVSAVSTACGVEPVVIGKPETYALMKILEFAGSRPEDSVMIGDRLDTDILLGNMVGMHTALVLTGVASEEDACAAPIEMKPERIISDLNELLDDKWGQS